MTTQSPRTPSLLTGLRDQVRELTRGLEAVAAGLDEVVAPRPALEALVAEKLAEWCAARRPDSADAAFALVGQTLRPRRHRAAPPVAPACLRRAALELREEADRAEVILVAHFTDGVTLRAAWRCPWDEVPGPLRERRIREPEAPVLRLFPFPLADGSR